MLEMKKLYIPKNAGGEFSPLFNLVLLSNEY